MKGEVRGSLRVRLAVCLVALAAFAAPGTAHGIIGGTTARDVPAAMTALFLDGKFLCGGTLVRSAAVLTAAHCVEGLPAHRLEVVVGRAELEHVAPEDLLAVQALRASPDADVAILSLASEATAEPARLAGPGDEPRWAPAVRARVLGYGATWLLGKQGVPLREITIPVRTDAECERNLVGYEQPIEICAGQKYGLRDACSGDSGGPLLVPDGWGGELVAGVVSRGLLCAVPTQYGIYSRVGGAAIGAWLAEVLPEH